MLIKEYNKIFALRDYKGDVLLLGISYDSTTSKVEIIRL